MLLEISFPHFCNASLLRTLTQLTVTTDVLMLLSWNLHWSSSKNVCLGWCLRCGYNFASCRATHCVITFLMHRVSCTQVFEWFKRFKGWREEIRDDQHPGHPGTSKTDANIEKVGEIVWQNCRLSIRAVAELINIDKETVQQILHNFNTKKCVRRWCRDSSLLNKRKLEWTFVLTFFKTLKMTQTF